MEIALWTIGIIVVWFIFGATALRLAILYDKIVLNQGAQSAAIMLIAGGLISFLLVSIAWLQHAGDCLIHHLVGRKRYSENIK